MIKEEFQDMIGQIVSDEDYKVIEKVYQFHPAVNEVSGKEEVAELYKSFGMTIFYDLLPRAERNCDLEKQLRFAQARVRHIEQEMEKLRQGSGEGGLDRGELNRDMTFQFSIDLSKVNDLPTLYRLIDKLKECMGGEDGGVQG